MRLNMQAPEMSTVRGSLAAAVLDDKVYAIGGGRPGISLETTEIYDPTLDTFMAGGCPLCRAVCSHMRGMWDRGTWS